MEDKNLEEAILGCIRTVVTQPIRRAETEVEGIEIKVYRITDKQVRVDLTWKK